MSTQNFMQKNQNGIITMICRNIPEHGFIDAIKIKDICKISIMTKEQKAGRRGEHDVKVIKVTGEREIISRNQLRNNYLCSNGKKIKLAFLNSGKEYIVYRNCNENYKVIKIPENCVGNFSNKKIKPGNYIVVPVNNQGEMDREKMGVVSASLFKKSFKIPMQEVIKRNIGKGSKAISLFDKPRNSNSMARPISLGAETNIKPPSISSTPIQQKINTPIQNKDNESNSKYKYTVINKIHDYNNKHVGFTVSDLKTNKIHQVTIVQLSQMCESKLVDNVMLVTKATGQKFLKGNGIEIKKLPVVMV